MPCGVSPPSNLNLPTRGISAHRGGLLGCPMNTLGAFQRAICRGVHQIELDVRKTLDNIIIVAHDDRVTNATKALHISESSLALVQNLKLAPCTGESKKQEYIPTLEEVLAIMPENIWINLDIKENSPHVAKLVAEAVAKAHRFDQVIFAARDQAAPAIRQVAAEAGEHSHIANMSRQLFRWQYIDSTINSCAEFIQLVNIPYLPFLRGIPNQDTMDRLDGAGIRVNFSWLREDNEAQLKPKLQNLFDRGVDFILVDHVEEAKKAACTIGVDPITPHWNGPPPFTCDESSRCPLDQSPQ